MSTGNATPSESPAKSNAGDYVLAAILTAVSIALAIWLLSPGSWPAGVIPSVAIRAGLVALLAIAIGGFIQKRLAAADWAMGDSHLTSLDEYKSAGVGPLPAESSPEAMYLDLIKRSVLNLVYEDRPTIFYDDQHEPQAADRFRIERRVMGEDAPTEAHTMIGLKRLNNLQECVEQILKEQVPGDLLEAGVLRGGAAIFLRAILKAHHCTDRRVIACDTFRSRQAKKPSLAFDIVLSILSFLAWIPSPALLPFVARNVFPGRQSNPPANLHIFVKLGFFTSDIYL